MLAVFSSFSQQIATYKKQVDAQLGNLRQSLEKTLNRRNVYHIPQKLEICDEYVPTPQNMCIHIYISVDAQIFANM